MKKSVISFLAIIFCSTVLFASGIEGKWTTTIETDNGPFTFYADYQVKGEVITGTLYNDSGVVEIYNGKINGDEFEYKFQLDYNELKHVCKLVDGKLEITSTGGNNDSKFVMVRVKEE